MDFFDRSHRDRLPLPKVVQDMGLFRHTYMARYFPDLLRFFFFFFDRLIEFSPILNHDMETTACSEEPWWINPENFYLPLVFYMEEDQEERIFGGWPLPTSLPYSSLPGCQPFICPRSLSLNFLPLSASPHPPHAGSLLCFSLGSQAALTQTFTALRCTATPSFNWRDGSPPQARHVSP